MAASPHGNILQNHYIILKVVFNRNCDEIFAQINTTCQRFTGEGGCEFHCAKIPERYCKDPREMLLLKDIVKNYL